MTNTYYCQVRSTRPCKRVPVFKIRVGLIAAHFFSCRAHLGALMEDAMKFAETSTVERI